MRRAAPFLLLALVAACGGGVDGPPAGAPTTGAVSTSATATTSSTTTAAPTGDPTAATAAPPPEIPATSTTTGSVLASALPAGSHAFTVAGTIAVSGALNSTEELPPDASVDVTDTGPGRQRIVLDIASDEGEGFTLTQDVTYLDRGLVLGGLAIHVQLRGYTDDRRLTASTTDPIASNDMAPGEERTAELSGPRDAAVVTLRYVGPEAVPTTGASAGHVHTRIDLTGEYSGTVELDAWLDPATGLPLLLRGDGTVSNALVRIDVDFEAAR